MANDDNDKRREAETTLPPRGKSESSGGKPAAAEEGTRDTGATGAPRSSTIPGDAPTDAPDSKV